MYQIFDIAIDSDISLPELCEVESLETVIKFYAGTDKSECLDNPDWFTHWKSLDGYIVASCAKTAEGYFLRFPAIADFTISYDLGHIAYFYEPIIPKETIRHLLLDHIIPKILGQLGRLVLHASAVITPNGKTIVFLGHSGWGKSTIASSFHENGARMITDDCLLIEQLNGKIYGIPNYYGLRLFNDSAKAIFSADKEFLRMAHYSDKKRLIMHRQEAVQIESKVHIDAFFFLNNPSGPSATSSVIIEPISGIRKFMELVEKMFILDTTDKFINTQQFENLRSLMIHDVSIFELSYPRKHSMLKVVQDCIYEII